MLRLTVVVIGLLGLASVAFAPERQAFVPAAVRPAPTAVYRHSAGSVPVYGQTVAVRHVNPRMGLFGLGAPELAVIAAIGLLVLGPDQVKKLAKDVGKVSAELKQVPEEFNKGMEIGIQERDARKEEMMADTKPPTIEAAPVEPKSVDSA